jgi:hypothetical protein
MSMVGHQTHDTIGNVTHFTIPEQRGEHSGNQILAGVDRTWEVRATNRASRICHSSGVSSHLKGVILPPPTSNPRRNVNIDSIHDEIPESARESWCDGYSSHSCWPVSF